MLVASARLHTPHIFLGGPVIDRPDRVTALFRHRSFSPLWETSDALGVALHPRPYPQGAKLTGGSHLRGHPSPHFWLFSLYYRRREPPSARGLASLSGGFECLSVKLSGPLDLGTT